MSARSFAAVTVSDRTIDCRWSLACASMLALEVATSATRKWDHSAWRTQTPIELEAMAKAAMPRPLL